MTPTPYTNIYDLFTTLIKDYRLVALWEKSETDFYTYLHGWLVQAVGEFSPRCNQSLSRDDATDEFDIELSEKNQQMLAKIMVKYWLSKEVNDVLQMRLKVQDRDFKTFAEANNLKEKNESLDRVKETLSQELVDYSYDNVDWDAWVTGNFI